LRKKVDFIERDFFKEPFSRAEIEKLQWGVKPSEMFNFRSPSFKKMELERDKLTNAKLIDLMLKEPRLIRRPVVKLGKKVYFSADAKVLAQALET
jgi:arsenate reductase-like glutaredoxin family protein